MRNLRNRIGVMWTMRRSVLKHSLFIAGDFDMAEYLAKTERFVAHRTTVLNLVNKGVV